MPHAAPGGSSSSSAAADRVLFSAHGSQPTTLAAAALLGATTVTVTSTDGMAVGRRLILDNRGYIITAIDTTTKVVTLATGLVEAASNGAAIRTSILFGVDDYLELPADLTAFSVEGLYSLRSSTGWEAQSGHTSGRYMAGPPKSSWYRADNNRNDWYSGGNLADYTSYAVGLLFDQYPISRNVWTLEYTLATNRLSLAKGIAGVTDTRIPEVTDLLVIGR